MADYFVDSTTGSDLDNGTTMDLAWATIEYALESGGLSAGDTVWVRRVHSETVTDSIAVGYSGTGAALIKVIGWPRAEETSPTEATWTNGSTTVDLVVGLSMDREKHLGRFAVGPDGEKYLITQITDSNTFIIDREYAGATVSGTSGVFTIEADEDYSLAQAVDDSGWTITKSDYNSDADDLPSIDFSSGNYQFRHNPDNFYYYANLDLGGGVNGPFSCTASHIICNGILIYQTGSSGSLYVYGYYHFKRSIIAGNSTGTGQRLFQITGAYVRLTDCAVYNAGDFALLINCGEVFLENVNIGVEAGNDDDDIAISSSGKVFGKNVKLGGVTGEYQPQGGWSEIDIENYGKVLEAHKRFNPQGTITKVDVVAGSGDPYKRSGGNDSVLEIAYNTSGTYYCADTRNTATPPILTHEFEATVNDNRRYRYYVQAEGAVAADELWIECEYVSAYDDTSEYVIKKVTSDESITIRTGADDWSQYIEVANIEPAVNSIVRIKCYCKYYHATNKIYIDPLPEVTT